MRRTQNHLCTTKIDSIIRLTHALERDINKIIGIQDSNQEMDKSLHQNAKPDVILNKLLEKLEINLKLILKIILRIVIIQILFQIIIVSITQMLYLIM
jgi:hypothetical protein